MISIRKIYILLLITSILFLNCEQKGENIPTFAPTASYHIQEGWKAFQSGDYVAAVDNFTAAKNRDALDSTAYLGLGWSNARLLDFEKSISNFQLMLSFVKGNSMRTDAYAGLAMTYSAQHNDSLAIDAARQALQILSDYQFLYDNKITAAKLHVVIAQNYYNSQNYLKALAEIDQYLLNGYVDNLLNDGILVSIADKPVQATVFSYTELSGRAELTLTKTLQVAGSTKEVDAELVEVKSIKNSVTGVAYQILGFEQGGGVVRFLGIPIPQAGETFLVDFLYANNYGVFLSRLSKTIQGLQS